MTQADYELALKAIDDQFGWPDPPADAVPAVMLAPGDLISIHGNPRTVTAIASANLGRLHLRLTGDDGNPSAVARRPLDLVRRLHAAERAA